MKSLRDAFAHIAEFGARHDEAIERFLAAILISFVVINLVAHIARNLAGVIK